MSLTLHTSLGDLKIELHCDIVPKLTFNILALAAANKYNGSSFTEICSIYGTRWGHVGTERRYSIWGGHMKDEFSLHLTHKERGVVSFANRGPNTNGSQFYHLWTPTTLNNVYSVVGKVIHGFDVLDAMERAPVSGKKCKPITDI